MGRRSRRRAQGGAPDRSGAPASSTDYRDPHGNVLTLRDSLSAGTLRQVELLDSKPAASARRVRISSRKGLSLGASQATVASMFAGV